jgi:hypothetical protein
MTVSPCLMATSLIVYNAESTLLASFMAVSNCLMATSLIVFSVVPWLKNNLVSGREIAVKVSYSWWVSITVAKVNFASNLAWHSNDSC